MAKSMLISLSALTGLALIFNTQGNPLVSSVGFSLTGFAICHILIPKLGKNFIRIGLKGKDMSKIDRPELPETMGAVPAIVYLFCMLFFIPFVFYKFLVTWTSGGGNREAGIEEYGAEDRLFPHNKLSEYLSAVLCLQSMLMLGVADDLFDIRWRDKFFLPAIAAIPLLIVYYVDFGITKVILPPFLHLGDSIDLGIGYYVYMAAVAIFCPNCINIYAGVNGLEVGQSLVIAVNILINDSLYIFLTPDHPAVDSHLLSAYLLIPLIGVSLALLKYNWWPAKVFVGDTYCYFAGMVFAVVGILGHFSKTLLLFFVPQIFNFLYSVPQLFKLVDCPRHRLPRFNPDTGKLEPSTVKLVGSRKPAVFILRVLAKFSLIGFYENDNVIEVSNMTLINLVLVNLGPMREDKLTTTLLVIQAGFGIFALVLRHTLALLVFGRDNW